MKFPQLGPACLVTAAFIGPGTVITASLAGADYGFSLLWALLFSMVVTISLQEMAARLGIVTQKGLAENIREACSSRVLKVAIGSLIMIAIVIGNGAYQSGNILGASLGLSHLFSDGYLYSQISIWPLLISLIAFIILFKGNYQFIERSLMCLVGLMSMAFLVTFILTKPELKLFFSGLLIPRIPAGASLTIIALIGTSVVPYSLFLHSSIVSKKWHKSDDLLLARKDIFVSIPLGGLISIAIVSTAAMAFFGKGIAIINAADLAPSLTPIMGEYSSVFIAIGLVTAGLSSALTAPLAAAFALSEILNLSRDLHSISFKVIWGGIILIGALISSADYEPIRVIFLAQIANGILLPLVTLFLLWIMNTEKLGAYKNGWFGNISAVIIFCVTLVLSARSLFIVFDKM
ncbi:Nramp family divalent metal transporter [uncultured Shewanella sp.]|uniref:Nramp family divalent metal transporter n=1 Tax=uncultured Shewanella sp. TaxID=173975 RepID=UPI0026350AB5|nr:Nramp family divalent metal transporter [uncultured Shewanella sp.]